MSGIRKKLWRLLAASIGTVTISTLAIPAPPAHAYNCTLCYELVGIAGGSGIIPAPLFNVLQTILNPIFDILIALPVDSVFNSNALTAPVYAQATAALSYTIPSPTPLAIALDGTAEQITLAAGKWRFEVSGQYHYDVNYANVLADANCSLPHPKWQDQHDYDNANLAAAGLPPAWSSWHYQRYYAGWDTSAGPAGARQLGLPSDQVLSVYVNGSRVVWTPTQADNPTTEDSAVNDLHCNTIDHTYYYDVTVPVESDFSFSLFDVYYPDNTPVGDGLNINVIRQLPLG